jgi:hypothetical protein
MEFNEKYLQGISKGSIRHKYYKKTVAHAEDMGVHVEGETPEKLLNINRPNEQEEIKKYRLETYQPVTQSLSEKVVNTVNKVFNPRLWTIDFEEQNLVGEDTLAKYITEDYPFYRSLMNFITETFTVKDFSDPNAAIVVMPQSFDIEETDLFEPVATVYDSISLVDFVDEEYYTFEFGDTIKIFTKTEILVFQKEVKSGKEIWILVFEYAHDFGFVPVFRLGGIIKGKLEPFYFESWIRGVLPHWNQVVQLTSDLQAAYVNHLYMDKWEFETECQARDCIDGLVKTEVQNGKDTIMTESNCSTCMGSGKVSKNPYSIYSVNRDAISTETNPIPPAGYIDKPISVVDKVEDRINKEEKRGLSSINMEIVSMVGNDQSGVAKTVDREDLNAFLSRYSRHVFEYVLPNLIFNIAAWRYGETSNIEDIVPTITQPKDFNVMSLDSLTAEYKDASNANVSANYLQHIEGEIVQSKFANNETDRKKNETIIKLQPFPGKSVDQLLTLQNLGQPEWKIYKSIAIIELVDMAIEDKSDFLDLDLKDKREIIDQMAKDAIGFVEEEDMISPEPTPIIPEIEPQIEEIEEEEEIEQIEPIITDS